jgi:peptide/nickel transport system substrate-binding protein
VTGTNPDGTQAGGKQWTRRDLLRVGGLAGSAALIGVPLAACSGSSGTGGAQQTAKLGRGGTLRLGVLGGSSSDTVVASAAVGVPDFARLSSLYNTVLGFDATGNIVPVLAESIESNADASVYTLRLRKGVTFHNGKTLTADDIIYSLQRVISNHYVAAPQLSAVNFSNITVLDPLTLRFNLDQPSVLFKVGLAAQGGPVNIVPVGYDPKAPVGTGPFKFKSFTPGQQSVFTRNPDYFMNGLPRLDSLQIIDYPDADARFNAFISDQLDAIDAVPTAQITSIQARSGTELLRANTGLALVNYMRLDVPPFNDPRVPQALKLIMDREKMIQVAGAGYGTLGDDVLGKYFPSYDTGLPQRQQDLDQARFLLKQAGQSGMTLQLATGNFTAGATEQAALLAQFASAAGFTINLNQTTEANLFGPKYAAAGYANSWTFSQDFWSGADYLYQASLNMAKGATVNETHFSNSQFNALFNEANSTADDAKRYELIHEMQVIDYNEGGLLLPYYGTIFDAYSTRFTGFKPAGVSGYSFGDYDFSGVALT